MRGKDHTDIAFVFLFLLCLLDGMPYVFSMFQVLLSRTKPKSTGPNRSYFLPDEDITSLSNPSSARSSALDAGGANGVPGVAATDAWCFTQRGFLAAYLSADEDRRVFMMNTPFNGASKDLMARRAEKKKLEIKWEAVKGLRNEYKSKVNANIYFAHFFLKNFSKFVCLVCDQRKRALVILPCAHFVLCSECFTEGMVCPQCKCYALGFVEALLDDNSLATLR